MDNAQSLIYQLRHGHPNKAEKRLSIYIFRSIPRQPSFQKYYNFLIFNATSQKAHGIRKKA